MTEKGISENPYKMSIARYNLLQLSIPDSSYEIIDDLEREISNIAEQFTPEDRLTVQRLHQIMVTVQNDKQNYPQGFVSEGNVDCRTDLIGTMMVLETLGYPRPKIGIRVMNHHPIAFYEQGEFPNPSEDFYLSFDFPTSNQIPYPRIYDDQERIFPYQIIFKDNYEYDDILRITDLMLLHSVADDPESQVPSTNHYQARELFLNYPGINPNYSKFIRGIS